MHIRAMRSADVESLDVLLRAAYGLETPYAEWLRGFVGSPNVESFILEDRGAPAGCVFAMDYRTVAYVALMAVDPATQRRGIASALFEALLAWGDARGRSWQLDATPSGAPLYAKYGFEDDGETIALGGIAKAPKAPARVRRADSSDLDAMAELDRQAFGADRRWALAALLDDSRNVALIGPCNAFSVARHVGTIGPIVAPDAASATAVFDAALSASEGRRMKVCIPTANAAALDLVRSRGFTETRRLRHMSRGSPDPGTPGTLWGRFSLAQG